MWIRHSGCSSFLIRSTAPMGENSAHEYAVPDWLLNCEKTREWREVVEPVFPVAVTLVPQPVTLEQLYDCVMAYLGEHHRELRNSVKDNCVLYSQTSETRQLARLLIRAANQQKGT